MFSLKNRNLRALFEPTLRWGAPILSLMLACSLCDPSHLGVWEDDIIYLELAESLAQGGGMSVPSLIHEPVVTKYPPLFPCLMAVPLGVTGTAGTATGVWILFLFQSLIFAGIVFLIVNRLGPAWGLSPLGRLLVWLLYAGNFLVLSSTLCLLSEGLMTLLMLALIDRILGEGDSKKEPARWNWIWVLLLASALCLTRSVGLILVLVLTFWYWWKNNRLIASGLGVGMVLAVILQFLIGLWSRWHPARGNPSETGLMDYYQGYGYHTGFYVSLLKEEGIGRCVGTLFQVIAHNFLTGLESFGNLLIPVQFMGNFITEKPVLSGTQSGLLVIVAVTVLILSTQGFLKLRHGRALIVMILSNFLLLLVWTWPFAGRFWVPLLPLILMGLVSRCLGGKRIAHMLLAGILSGSLVLNGLLVLERAGEQTADPLPESHDQSKEARVVRSFMGQQDWLKKNLKGVRGDILLGGLITLGKAREFGVQGAWVEALMESRCFLGRVLKLHREGYSPACLRDLRQRLQKLASQQPPGARLFIQMDPTLSPAMRRSLRGMVEEGSLQVVYRSEDGGFDVFECNL
ncbi:MAG: hypothetical protein SFY92_00785 [Verrucomicrobiae bacterium]|nr:hypothetical protein [Verrucomicrobiae bacterium]